MGWGDALAGRAASHCRCGIRNMRRRRWMSDEFNSRLQPLRSNYIVRLFYCRYILRSARKSATTDYNLGRLRQLCTSVGGSCSRPSWPVEPLNRVMSGLGARQIMLRTFDDDGQTKPIAELCNHQSTRLWIFSKIRKVYSISTPCVHEGHPIQLYQIRVEHSDNELQRKCKKTLASTTY